MTCPLKDSCKNKSLFKVSGNIRNHFFRKHANAIVLNEKNDGQSLDRFLEDAPRDAPSCSNFGEGNEEFNLLELSNIHQNYEELSLKLLSHLLISLESKYMVTKTALQALVRGITDIINLNSKYIDSSLNDRGNKILLSDIEKDLFFATFNSKTGLLKTNWYREKYYKTNFSFVSPTEVRLNDGKKESFLYYVPILQTLRTLLKNKTILEQCLVKKQY